MSKRRFEEDDDFEDLNKNDWKRNRKNQRQEKENWGCSSAGRASALNDKSERKFKN